LIWLSGPTSRVVTFSITRKTILWTLASTALTLMLVGSVLQWVGLRVAIEARPDLAQTLGAVTSASEQKRIEAHYQQQLAALEQQVQTLVRKVVTLESTKKQLINVLPAEPPRLNSGGQGGPLRLLSEFSWFAPNASQRFSRLGDELWGLQKHVDALNTNWLQEMEVVHKLPIAPPIAEEHHISSPFGRRRDPFTGALSMHEGLDYVAPYGTAIQATAPGTVSKATYWGPYGLIVEVQHDMGFSTRYAHLSRLLVKEGDAVQPGQDIGLLGNSGRSTGPHLHYEIRHRESAIPPHFDQVIRLARHSSWAGISP